MSWRDRLTRATWRGIEFLTESHEAHGGRKLVVHEFPGADVSLVEDQGAKAWDYRLTCYFIGDDYDLRRDEFLVALNQPTAAWLNHPWLGKVWVRPRTWGISESNAQGRSCTVTVEWVDGGGQDFDRLGNPDRSLVGPRGVAANGVGPRIDAAQAAIRLAAQAAVGAWAPKSMSADGLTALIARVQQRLEGLRRVLSLARLPLTWMQQVQGMVAGVKTDVRALLAIPREYAQAWRSLANALGCGPEVSGGDANPASVPLGRVLAAEMAAHEALLTLASAGSAIVGGSSAVAAANGDDLLVARPALAALLAAQARAALIAPIPGGVVAGSAAFRANVSAEALLAATLLVTASASAALAEYQVDEDRDAALATMLSAVDELLPAVHGPVFEALALMRAQVAEALRAQDISPSRVRQVVGPVPAAVLAHQFGVEESMLLARNRPRHPLFMSGDVRG